MAVDQPKLALGDRITVARPPHRLWEQTVVECVTDGFELLGAPPRLIAAELRELAAA